MNTVNHLSPAAVLELARLNGIPVEDEAMAARIAAGGAAAAAAVEAIHKTTASGQDIAVLSAVEPADYLPTLESLAGTQSPDGERQAFKDIQKLKEFGEMDLVAVSAKLVSGELRSVGLVRAALERAERAQARTHCFLSLEK
ncbi:MAG: hypothetical protein ACO32S_08815, partial [Steroidobacteraceae bacterium]